MPTIGTHAREFVEYGIPIFPCRPSDKAPLNGKGGHNKATTEPVIIESWIRDFHYALIGIPNGEDSGVLVVDLDVVKQDDHDKKELTEYELGYDLGWKNWVKLTGINFLLVSPSLLAGERTYSTLMKRVSHVNQRD